MLTFVTATQSQVLVWRPLRLLYETVQENHAVVLVNIEQHSCNSIPLKMSPHLINSAAHRPACRHAYGPAELDRLNIFTYALAILRVRQTSQPFPHGLLTSLRPKEDYGNPFTFAAHSDGSTCATCLSFATSLVYHKRYVDCFRAWCDGSGS